jgi:CheY-like chemotaxis protein
LKADPSTREIPVCVISIDGDEQACLTNGAVSFLEKPVDQAALEGVFDHFQPPPSPAVQNKAVFSLEPQVAGKTLPAQALAGSKILVVDDDMRNTFALSGALEEYGGDVVLAGNGQIAVDALEQDANISLVVMDIMMPIMDGYEAIAKIRENARYGDIPIVALTVMASSSDRDKCMEVGASDYLTKPIEIDLLVSRIAALLESAPRGSRSA